MVGDCTKEDEEIKGNRDRVDDTGCGGEGYIEDGNADNAKDVETCGEERKEEDSLSTIAAAEDTMSLLCLLDATFCGEEGGGVDHGWFCEL